MLERPVIPCDAAPVIPTLAGGGFLGLGTLDANSQLRYSSNPLAAQVQGRIWQRPELSDYGLFSQTSITYIPVGSRMHIFYYRPATVAATSAGTGAR